jgi:antiviral helicase SKI2
MTALEELRQRLMSTDPIPEVAWGRMRSLEFQEGLRRRDNLALRLSKLGCTLCGDFSEHVSCSIAPGWHGELVLIFRLVQYEILHERKTIEAELRVLKLALSDQNLELLPDYEQRVDVLKTLQFIDDNSTVLLKGRVACEVSVMSWFGSTTADA